MKQIDSAHGAKHSHKIGSSIFALIWKQLKNHEKLPDPEKLTAKLSSTRVSNQYSKIEKFRP